MSGNLENILMKGDCIPEDMLLQYIQGKLDGLDAHLIEKHLLECEFCSEAVEGLKMMEASDARKIIADINSEIDMRVSEAETGRVIPFMRYYKIAAVIALFILSGGIYWYLKNIKKENILAENVSTHVNLGTDSVPVQIAPQEYSTSGAPVPVTSQPKFSLRKDAQAAKQQSAEREIESAGSKELLTVNKNESAKDDAAKQSNDYSNQEVVVTKAEDKKYADGISRKSSKPVSADAQSAASAPAITESNMAVLDEVKTDGKIKYSEKKNGSSQNDMSQLFINAKANYDQKKYAEAASDFEKLMNDTSTAYYDDAKWYLAKCYNKIHKNSKSRKLLKEIAASNSVHHKEAEGLLQESQ
jgi:hypothetical protein